jgi:hypothetical protein
MVSKTIKAHLKLKGTRYYLALDAVKAGSLVPGAALSLRHEPNNTHDFNAIAVHLASDNSKIGHLNRKTAPEYVSSLRSKAIISVKVSKVDKESKTDSSLSIIIIVVRLHPDYIDLTAIIRPKIIYLSDVPGVYILENLKTGRVYVGQSLDILKRAKTHLTKLIRGNHENQELQRDFTIFGINGFQFQIVVQIADSKSRLEAEAVEISNLHAADIQTYNMTIDGQGVLPTRQKPSINRPLRVTVPASNTPVVKLQTKLTTKLNAQVTYKWFKIFVLLLGVFAVWAMNH